MKSFVKIQDKVTFHEGEMERLSGMLAVKSMDAKYYTMLAQSRAIHIALRAMLLWVLDREEVKR